MTEREEILDELWQAVSEKVLVPYHKIHQRHVLLLGIALALVVVFFVTSIWWWWSRVRGEPVMTAGPFLSAPVVIAKPQLLRKAGTANTSIFLPSINNCSHSYLREVTIRDSCLRSI